MAQDRYTQWLRIKPGDRPPDHYTLLGLERFCEDAAQIEKAAHEQLDKLDQYALSPDAANRAACQQMMNEVAQARVVLKDGAKREAYNRELSLRLGLPVAPLLEATVERKPMVLATTARAAVAASVPSSTPRRDTEVKQPVEPARVAGATSQVPRWLLVVFGTSIAAVLVVVFLLSGASDSLPEDSYHSASTPMPTTVVDRFEAAANQWQKIRVADSPSKSKAHWDEINTLMSAAKTAIVDHDYAEAQSVLATVEARMEQLCRLNSASAQFAKLRAEQDFTYLSHYAKADVDACLEQVRITSAADADVDTALAAYAAATKFLVTAKLNADAMDRLAIVRTEHERELAKHDRATLIQTGPDWIEYEKHMTIANDAASGAAQRVEAFAKATAALTRAAAESGMVTHLRALDGEVGHMLQSVDGADRNSKAATEWAAVLDAQKRGKDLTRSIAERMKALEEAKRRVPRVLELAAGSGQFRKSFEALMAIYDVDLLEKRAGFEWQELQMALTKARELEMKGERAAIIAAYAQATMKLERAVQAIRDLELIEPLGTPIEVGEDAQHMRFKPDGKEIALLVRDGARMWNVANGKPSQVRVQNPRDLFNIEMLAFPTDGSDVSLIGTHGIKLYSLLTGTLTSATYPDGRAVFHKVSAREAVAAICLSDRTSVQVWNLKTNKPGPIIRHSSPVHGVCLSAGGFNLLTTELHKPDVTLWNTTTGARIAKHALLTKASGYTDAKGTKHPVSYAPAIAMRPDGSEVAIWEDDKIVVYDAHSGKATRAVINDVKKPLGTPFMFDFSPDASRLLVCAMHRSRPGAPPTIWIARLYDARTGDPVGAQFAPGFREAVGTQKFPNWAFSPDGKLLGCIGEEGVLRILSVDTGDKFGPNLNVVGRVQQIEFSPTGPLLALRLDKPSRVQIWNLDPVLRDPFVRAPKPDVLNAENP